jgi:hypothetical protein
MPLVLRSLQPIGMDWMLLLSIFQKDSVLMIYDIYFYLWEILIITRMTSNYSLHINQQKLSFIRFLFFQILFPST